jgi:hypothetical protein
MPLRAAASARTRPNGSARKPYMDTSIISAFISAQVGQFQFAVAARLARTSTDGMSNNASSITQLVDAAQQNAEPLANAAAGLGTNLDVSC